MDAARPVGERGRVRVVGVGHRQRDDLRAVAVRGVMVRDVGLRVQRAGDHEAHAALFEHVRHAVAPAGLQPGVGDLAEPEGMREEVRGLRGVAHVQLDVVDSVQRHEIGGVAVVDAGGSARSGGHGLMIRLNLCLNNRDLLRLSG